jgi:hypothetical protein
MAVRARVAPPYSMVLVCAPSNRTISNTMTGALITATRHFIAVGCRSHGDGMTDLALGASLTLDPGDLPAFEGFLETPERIIAVRSVVGDTFLQFPVPGRETLVRVWVNDAKEPDRILVGVE